MAEAATCLREQYGKSLSAIRRLGGLACGAELAEGTLFDQMAYSDFATHCGEMIKTDSETRQYIDVDNIQTFSYIDGHTMSPTGEPMIDMLRRAHNTAHDEAAAHGNQSDPDRFTQVERDHNDCLFQEQADALQPGQAIFAITMDPKNALRRNPKKWGSEGLGYTSGIAYMQGACRVDEATMVRVTLSIDASDETIMREALREYGVTVPDSVSQHAWLLHGVPLEANADQLEATMRGFRRHYYEAAGVNTMRISWSEFMEANEPIFKANFRSYYPAIAQALDDTGCREVLAEFSRSVLMSAGDHLDESVRQQLQAVVHGDHFTDEMGRALDAAVRYATVEKLREGLQFKSKTATASSAVRAQKAEYLRIDGIEAYLAMGHLALSTTMAQSVSNGVRAGRSYGGCSGTSLSSAGTVGENLTDADKTWLRSIGVSFDESEKSAHEDGESDSRGPLVFYCTQGHRNTRKRDEPLLEVCQTKPCKPGSVGCKSEVTVNRKPPRTRGIGNLIAPAFWQKLDTARKGVNSLHATPKRTLLQQAYTLAA